MTVAIPPRFALSSYVFDLPQDRVAQVPAERRSQSRLMVLPRRAGAPQDATFAGLPGLLRAGDLLVVNDTRVIPARLFARKETGGRVELLVLERDGVRFRAMFGTHRGLREGAELAVLGPDGEPSGARVRVEWIPGDGTAALRTADGEDVDAMLARLGHMPLPPYIRREDGRHRELDRERYQTVYADAPGAVAAPTAGLHFTPELLDDLERAGIEVARITLHVGPGTFKPIAADDVRRHDVGLERYRVAPEAAARINRALDDGRRVIAVGTTVTRTLEAAGATGRVVAGEGATRLLIVPGHRFRVVSGLVTNFHLPGSSLIVLVSAFAGRRRVLAAYRRAVASGYRFYSYGDAMLVL
jgi:S-adenosylmethionine:tRNA ribosyltransferase-isomerase